MSTKPDAVRAALVELVAAQDASDRLKDEWIAAVEWSAADAERATPIQARLARAWATAQDALAEQPAEPVAHVLFREDDDGLEPVMFYGPGTAPDPATLKSRFTLRDVWLSPPTPHQAPSVADDVLEALDLSPEKFRTEGGAINRGKLRAAILHPYNYLPPDHWLQARFSKPGGRPAAELDAAVDRFLGWRLPDDFSPDCGVSFSLRASAASVQADQRAELDRLLAEHAATIKLATFGAWAAREFRDTLSDVDGGSAQEAMERFGVIEMHQVTEPCGEGCVCAEYDFPCDCYRFPPAISEAMDAALAAKGEGAPPAPGGADINRKTS